MHTARFVTVRRRVLDDPMFRAGLRMDFAGTLIREGLLDQLTLAQQDDLEMALLLHDAFNLPAATRARAGARPVLKTVEKSDTTPATPVPPRPVSLSDWRARRAR
jgi:hypothetical protein